MILEPKPPSRKDEEPRFRYKGDFYPLGKHVTIVTPTPTFTVGTPKHLRMPGDDSLCFSEDNTTEVPASGELQIFNDGGNWLELGDKYRIETHPENGSSSERRICGHIENGSKAVLLVGCSSRGGRDDWGAQFYWHWVSSEYCLIQRGQWSHKQRYPEFQVFGECEPVVFDKVRFVLDGLQEFTGSAFEHKFSSIDRKNQVDLVEWAQHGFTCEQTATKEWHKPDPLDLVLKTENGDVRFRIERQGRLNEYSVNRGWETYCVMEFPKMLSLNEINRMLQGVKAFFDFLFQTSLALRSVWVYNSKQVLTDVNLKGRNICPNKEVDLSSVSVPVCWQLYFNWGTVPEDNRSSLNSSVKLGFDDFEENGKNLLGKYLGKFIDVVVHRSDEDLHDFITSWIAFTHLDSLPLRVALSIHFPALEYFAQKKGLETRTWKEKAKKPKQWMRCLMEPLGDDYLEFAKKFAEYRNKYAVHHDVDYRESSWLLEEQKQGYEKLRVAMRFHFLNLLQPNHEELNKKLASQIWDTAWR